MKTQHDTRDICQLFKLLGDDALTLCYGISISAVNL